MKVEYNIKGGDRWKPFVEALKVSHEAKGCQAGVFDTATNEETGRLVASYAFWNEYGTKNIPSRPFMRQTIQQSAGKWAQTFRAGVSGRITSIAGTEQAWRLTGNSMKQDIVAKIASNMEPPNAEATIKRKTRETTTAGALDGGTSVSGTLIDTGTLIKSIDYKVIDR